MGRTWAKVSPGLGHCSTCRWTDKRYLGEKHRTAVQHSNTFYSWIEISLLSPSGAASDSHLAFQSGCARSPPTDGQRESCFHTAASFLFPICKLSTPLNVWVFVSLSSQSPLTIPSSKALLAPSPGCFQAVAPLSFNLENVIFFLFACWGVNLRALALEAGVCRQLSH